MPTKTYYLNEAKTEELTVKWGMFFRNVEVFYQQHSLGVVPSKHALEQGYHYQLPDGRSLVAQLSRAYMQQELELRLEGHPVPGSATHPRERVKKAWYMLLIVGGLNAVLGALVALQPLPALQQFGLGWGSFIEGLLYIGLGWWGYSKLAPVAFGAACALMVLDWVLLIAGNIGAGNVGLGGVFLRFFLCLLAYRGMQGARQLRAEAQLVSQ
jgi:hypothetical protein